MACAKLLAWSLLCLMLVMVTSTEKKIRYTADWASLDARPIPSWYKAAKFGIFMHWSVFSVTNSGFPNFEDLLEQGKADEVAYMTENYAPGTTYTDLCSLFTARYYNASQWVEMFENAGAKYLVLISKHLEGYCNWNTKYSERWNSVACGPKRDLVGEMEQAVRKSGGMKFGIYHGMMDILNPIWRADSANHHKTNDFVVTKTMPQLHELVNNYKPDLLWSDADYDANWRYWNSTGFLSWLYNDSPVKDNVVVNDRWGQETHCLHGGFMTCKDGYNPLKLQKRYFECCAKSGSNWAYNKKETISQIMTPTDALTLLVQVVSCGGNLLLNIAPTHDGLIMPIFQHLLSEMGMYLDRNGEAIYDSKPWTTQNDTLAPNVWYTQQSNNGSVVVYACITESWPGMYLQLAAPRPSMDTEVTLLGNNGTLKWSFTDSKTLKISMPILPPDTKLKHGWVLKLTNLKS